MKGTYHHLQGANVEVRLQPPDGMADRQSETPPIPLKTSMSPTPAAAAILGTSDGSTVLITVSFLQCPRRSNV